MSSWNAFHIHYSQVDRLILECVGPFIDRHRQGLAHCYWERHYAGGSHLRVRLNGTAEALEEASRALAASAEDFLERHPSPDVDDYSESRAAALLEREGVEPADEDLTYRNNAVLERSYLPDRRSYKSAAATDLMEDFRHDIMPLEHRILGGRRPVKEAVLRLYFAQAILAGLGDLRKGSVSWKSHWEGFAATFSSVEVVDRIRAAYESRRPVITRWMSEVAEGYEDGFADDAVLGGWRQLWQTYKDRVRKSLEEGESFTEQPATPEEAAQMREKMQSHLLRDSDFVSTFWSDERFLASIQYDLSFQVPRMMTNLFYLMVSFAGISPIDRHAFCYFSHRTVEEHFECDLNDILKQNIQRTLEAHGDRWQEQA